MPRLPKKQKRKKSIENSGGDESVLGWPLSHLVSALETGDQFYREPTLCIRCPRGTARRGGVLPHPEVNGIRYDQVLFMVLPVPCGGALLPSGLLYCVVMQCRVCTLTLGGPLQSLEGRTIVPSEPTYPCYMYACAYSTVLTV